MNLRIELMAEPSRSQKGEGGPSAEVMHFSSCVQLCAHQPAPWISPALGFTQVTLVLLSTEIGIFKVWLSVSVISEMS